MSVIGSSIMNSFCGTIVKRGVTESLLVVLDTGQMRWQPAMKFVFCNFVGDGQT